MSEPLHGIKIVDCSQWLMGPSAAAILGDLGADVIKIEERVTGDPVRAAELMATAVGTPLKRNPFFECGNRNKRSIALDLRKEKGQEIVYKLIKKTDVLLHSFRIGAAQRLGLDYETLSRHNSKLIYAGASGWGPKGPDRAMGAFEPAAMARSGSMYLVGEPGMPPLRYATGFGDVLGGIILVLAILAALRARDYWGLGQEVDVSLLGSLIALAAAPVTYTLLEGVEYPRRHRAQGTNPLYTWYKCSDGKWILLGMMQADRYWSAFCKVMGIEHLEKDPRFENLKARDQNAEELIRILDEIFTAKTLGEWMELLKQGGDFIYAPIQTLSEMVTDPQVLANEYIMDFSHPSLGNTKLVGFPYKFGKTPASVRREAPEFGQHTEEILLEIGYTWEEIAELKDQEVI